MMNAKLKPILSLFEFFSLFAFLFCVETFASIDITGPNIKQIQMKTLTVTVGDTITVEAIVNDESGVQWGSMQLLNRTLGVGQNNSRKGTQFEKVGEEKWIANFHVDENWPSGEYTIFEVLFQDNKGNFTDLTPLGELSSFFPSIITVTGTDPDITGPDIKRVQMKTSTVTAGDTITVEAVVNDESGIQWGSMQLLNRTLGVGQNNSRKGTQFEKVGEEKWIANFNVDENWPEGEYTIFEVLFQDNKGNFTDLTPLGELSSFFPSIITVGHCWQYITLQESTCKEDGREIAKCILCDQYKPDSERMIPKVGHLYGNWTITKEADCTHDGLRTQRCVYCGNSIEETIPATGHTWSNAYTIDKAASEKEDGLKSIHCLVCDTIKEGSSVVIPAEKSDPPIPVEPLVTSISLKANPSTTICAGNKVSIVAKVEPEDAYPAVSWKSSNTKYATVASNGAVVTKKSGIGKTVTITATAKDGSKKSAKIKIKIVKDGVTKITLKSTTSMKAGTKQTIKATINGGKTANKVLKWTTSNKKYATVNSKGVVTALKSGKGKNVAITATATDGTGIKGSIKIKIK